MKQVLVDGQVVILNNVDEGAKLTPRIARSAASIAGRPWSFVAESLDDFAVGYKLNPKGVRKYTLMPDGEWK